MNRRDFIKATLAGSALYCAPASMGLNLSLAQSMLQQGQGGASDYKALVCVFLYGGHDSLNLLIPTASDQYQTYANVRQTLAYERQALTNVTPLQSNRYQVAMPSFATSLLQLFEQQQLSVVSNVGPMLARATKTELQQNQALRPPQLFSHNDQQALWQNGLLRTDANTGWAGRMADLMLDTNATLPINYTMDGNNLWQSGVQSQLFSMNNEGPEEFEGLDPQYTWNQTRYDALQRIMGMAQHPLEQEYARRINSAETHNRQVAAALSGVDNASVTYPQGNHLSGQLAMVAKLIQSQAALGQQRQIFYVGLGGFDTHDNQVNLLPSLVNRIGDALLAFQNDLTARGVSQNVVTFTQSDFGRTLTSNGDGTDHGWGGHQLVMGEPIRGGNIVGDLPELALGSNDDLDDGRIIPQISVDQYGANLASWFGLSSSEISEVFPNLANVGTRDLGLFV